MEHSRRVYTVTDNKNLFEDIYYLLITVSSMFVAYSYKTKGSSQFHPPSNDQVWLDGKATNRTYGFSINRPLDDAIKYEKPPAYIEFFTYGISENELSSPSTGEFIKYLTKPLTTIFSSYFIGYYERSYIEAKTVFDNRYGVTIDKKKKVISKFDQWPNSWRMGWLVRNALVHNGKIYYNNENIKTPPPPVTWYNASVSTNNQGDQLLGNIFNHADLLILLLEMNEELV